MTAPLVARPRILLINSIGWSGVLIFASIFGWYALPESIRVLFTPIQIWTLIFFVFVMIFIMFTMALSWVRADADGLKVRNGLRTHRLGWDAVRGIRYRTGDPWAFAELDDDERLMLLGIMRVDGPRADDLVEKLRAMRADAAGAA